MAKTPGDEVPFEQQREAFARGALQGEAQALRARQTQAPPGRRAALVVALVVIAAALAVVWMLVGRPLVQQTVDVDQDSGGTAPGVSASAEPAVVESTAEVLDDPGGAPAAPGAGGAPADHAGAGAEPAAPPPVVLDDPAPAPAPAPQQAETAGPVEDLVDDVGGLVGGVVGGVGDGIGGAIADVPGRLDLSVATT